MVKKQRELTCLHDKRDENDDHDDEDFGDESADEKSYDPPVTDDARQNSRKAKQMIAQMFTDADNSYVHSDDEESEQILLRQRILKQTVSLSTSVGVLYCFQVTFTFLSCMCFPLLR